MRRNLYDRSVMAAKTTRRKYKKKAIVGNADFVFRVIEGLGGQSDNFQFIGNGKFQLTELFRARDDN